MGILVPNWWSDSDWLRYVMFWELVYHSWCPCVLHHFCVLCTFLLMLLGLCRAWILGSISAAAEFEMGPSAEMHPLVAESHHQRVAAGTQIDQQTLLSVNGKETVSSETETGSAKGSPP